MNQRPNILFLMTDQQRWDALGCVNPMVKTPNLDALAARGVRFSQAVCNVPMCVPSRYSMMSGLYGSQCGVRHNTQFIPTDAQLPVPMFPQRLHDLGYQTAGFGKTHWYLGERFQRPGVNVETSCRGFEVRAQARPTDPTTMQPGAAIMQREIPEVYATLTKEQAAAESIAGYLGQTSSVPAEQHREGWLVQQALRFLEQDRDRSRPLFLYLSFDFPHAPFNVPAGYEELYDLDSIPDLPAPPANLPSHVAPDQRAIAWRQLTPLQRRRSILRYYALCSYCDDLFGQVLRQLEREETFVIFTSDHGEMLGERDRFSKYCLYDASVRVPLIVAGPEVRSGVVDDRPAELVDVLPTLVDMAGGEAAPELAGRSLLQPPCRLGTFAEMHGTGYEVREPHLTSRWREGTPVQMAPAYMWRTNEWKLILSLPGHIDNAMKRLDETRGELYHMATDPHEWNNLYDNPAHLPMRENLTRQLLMHLACNWARYPWQAARAKPG